MDHYFALNAPMVYISKVRLVYPSAVQTSTFKTVLVTLAINVKVHVQHAVVESIIVHHAFKTQIRDTSIQGFAMLLAL